MKLVDVYSLAGKEAGAPMLLYEILDERPLSHGISHKEMPSFADHLAFINTQPFRYWYLIEYASLDPFCDPRFIGAIECLPTNEFGIHLLKEYQGQGLGTQAVELFLSTHEPLPAIPAVRNGHWLANVAPANEHAMRFFQTLGFHKIQETFEL